MPINTEHTKENEWAQEFKDMGINCGRTIKRFIKTMVTLSRDIGKSIAAASEDPAEAKAIYRLLGNKKITEEVVLDSHRKETLRKIKNMDEQVILAIQDTTELNYTGLKKTKGLGDYGSQKNSRGLIVHSSMAATTSGIALGLLDQNILARDPAERGKSKERKNRPIEEKESNKWLESMEKSSQDAPSNIQLVHVCDREADMFEFFNKAIEKNQSFLVRAVQNRKTKEEIKLFDKVKNEPAAGEVVVSIPRDARRGISKREATLEIKYAKANILASVPLQKRFGKGSYLPLSIIVAKEVNPPEGIEPIEWYLVTNCKVESFDEAFEKVNWYVQRWKIERFHYVLKSGCNIEKLQERDAEPLKKLILMYSVISIRILGLTHMARINPEASCEEMLEEEEWKVLYRIANKTSQVPEVAPTIKEAVSYIAKIGGFLGRNGDGDPGVKVIWRGLKELNVVLKYYNYLFP